MENADGLQQVWIFYIFPVFHCLFQIWLNLIFCQNPTFFKMLAQQMLGAVWADWQKIPILCDCREGVLGIKATSAQVVRQVSPILSSLLIPDLTKIGGN